MTASLSQQSYTLALINDSFMNLLSTTNGRDKLAKIVVSLCRVAGHCTDSREALGSLILQKSSISIDEFRSRVVSLEGSVGTCRKALRLGRELPGLVSLCDFLLRYVPFLFRKSRSAKSAQTQPSQQNSLQPIVLDVLKLVNSVFLALFFFLDHLNWFAKMKLLFNGERRGITGWLHNSKASKYADLGSYALTISISSGLVVELHVLSQLFAQEQSLLRDHALIETAEELHRKHQELNRKKFDLLMSICANVCDLLCAIAAVNFVKLSAGSQGILGVINGAIGVYKLWQSPRMAKSENLDSSKVIKAASAVSASASSSSSNKQAGT